MDVVGEQCCVISLANAGDHLVGHVDPHLGQLGHIYLVIVSRNERAVTNARIRISRQYD